MVNGEFHRDGCKPSVIWANGTKEWHKHDKHHNEDGPAIVFADGSDRWYLDGIAYTEQEWKNEMFKRCFSEPLV